MNQNETPFANAIRNWVNSDLCVYETSVVYSHLRIDFGLSDDDIRALGYDFLIPAPEEPEPNETKIYRFRYVCTLETYIGVEAHDEIEAEKFADDEFFRTSFNDMECIDSDFELIEIE